MSDWYLVRQGSRQGPLSAGDIRKMAQDGIITPDDLLWREDMPSSVKASQIKGLFSVPDAASRPESSHSEADNLESLQAAVKQTAKTGVRAGTTYAKAAMSAGAKKLKATFGNSLKETLASGRQAAGHLRKHPFRFTIATIVLLIGCGLSAFGFITLILLPVFVMGYIVYMESLILEQQPSFAMFIHFMRHGWNSIWHLFMMLASFFVTTALVMCPGIIIGLVLWLSLGTLGAGIGQISQSLSSNKPAEVRNYSSFEQTDFSAVSERPSAIGRFFGRLGAEAAMYLMAAGVILLTVLVLTPLQALLILHFVFARDVACSGSGDHGSFNLVYDSFVRMLKMGRTQWKLLLCSGLYLSTTLVLLIASLLLLGRLFTYVNLYMLSEWAIVVLLPFALFVFVIYGNVFFITTSLNLSQHFEASATAQPQEAL